MGNDKNVQYICPLYLSTDFLFKVNIDEQAFFLPNNCKHKKQTINAYTKNVKYN